MGNHLSPSVQGDLASLIQGCLGPGEVHVQKGQNGVFVSVLVDKSVFGEVRVEFEDFEAGHWEVHQRVALWNHSVSAHSADTLAKLLVDVATRVREAEIKALSFMQHLPGARVSSEFSPLDI